MKLSDSISLALMRYAVTNASDIVLPNYYIGTNEMDVMKITSSGYITEYEIKISKSDFLADFKKSDFFDSNKHTKLAEGKSPANKFYFVVPKDLITVDEIPDYCGLIYYQDGHLMDVKKARLLHKNKFTNWSMVAHKLGYRERLWRWKLSKSNKEINRLNDIIDKLKSNEQLQPKIAKWIK